MAARIIDRGRGPEIEGTRITVYDIMDYYRENDPPERIAEWLRLTLDQVQVAIDYIDANRADVERVYQQIMERHRRGNPEWVKKILDEGVADLKRRIEAMKRNGTPRQSDGGQ